MAFDSVFGQDRVKRIITSSLDKNRLAHAYLFHGPPGVGKDALAISVAMHLNCKEKRNGGCGACPSCHSIQNLVHANFRLILPVPTRPKAMKEEKYLEILHERAVQRMTNAYQQVSYLPEISALPVIGIDQIRTMKQEMMLKVSGGGCRVFLFSHADMLTLSASNSLLKILEEPPSGNMLILTTSNPGQLLETIVSRCQVVRFHPLLEEEIEEALIKRWSVPKDKAGFIAKMSGGSLQRGLQFMDEGFDQLRETAVAFLDSSMGEDALQRMEGVDALLSGRERQEIQGILHVLQIWIRDLYQMKLGFPKRVMNMDRADTMHQFLQKWPAFRAESGIKSVERAIDFVEKNVYLDLIIFSLCQELNQCNHS